MAVAALAAAAGSVRAQTAAPGQASITIAEVLRLDVVDGGTSAEEMRVGVTANRRWQLVAVLEDGSGQTWNAGPVASGGPGRVPVSLSYRRLVEESGAPRNAAVRFTLSAL